MVVLPHSSVQSLSCVRLFATPWTAAHQPPSPSPTPRVYSNSCPLSWWCHPTISSSAGPFSSCLQSFPASEFFPVGQLSVFSSGLALHIRWPKYWNFSFSISPSSEYSGLISFKFIWLISLLSKEISGVFSSTTIWKHQFFSALLSLWSNSHICTWLLKKNHSFDYMNLCQQSDVSAF